MKQELKLKIMFLFFFFLTFQAADTTLSSKYMKYKKKCIESERNWDLKVSS